MDDDTTIRSFKDLRAWQKAHVVVLLTYRATQSFPRSELFGLAGQMRRAAISAESNIAEGFGRNTAKDKQQFYAMAKGSLNELQSQSLTAHDLGFLEKVNYEELDHALLVAIKLCCGLQRTARDRAT